MSTVLTNDPNSLPLSVGLLRVKWEGRFNKQQKEVRARLCKNE